MARLASTGPTSSQCSDRCVYVLVELIHSVPELRSVLLEHIRSVPGFKQEFARSRLPIWRSVPPRPKTSSWSLSTKTMAGPSSRDHHRVTLQSVLRRAWLRNLFAHNDKCTLVALDRFASIAATRHIVFMPEVWRSPPLACRVRHRARRGPLVWAPQASPCP